MKVLNGLIARHTKSRPLPAVIREQENSLLLFAVKIEEIYSREGQEIIISTCQDLVAVLEKFEGALRTTATHWADRVGTLRPLAENFVNDASTFDIGDLSRLCDLSGELLLHPVFRRIMSIREYTVGKGKPDVFDGEAREAYGIPSEWDSANLVKLAKLGRRLDRISELKSGATAICEYVLPDALQKIRKTGLPPANPIFSRSIGDMNRGTGVH